MCIRKKHVFKCQATSIWKIRMKNHRRCLNLCDKSTVFRHTAKENFFSTMPRYKLAIRKNLKTSLTIRRTNTRDMHTKTGSEYVKQYSYRIFL